MHTVSADNKRDRRTIEQVLADTRAKKRMRTEGATLQADEGSTSLIETSPSEQPSESSY